MKAASNPKRISMKVGTGTVDAFIGRSLSRARKLDRGERLAPELRLTFEDPAGLIRVLSPERIRVLETVRLQSRPISSLALVLRRDRAAVRRDVKILESFGLVKTQKERNPGHGLMNVVKPLANRYRLTAII